MTYVLSIDEILKRVKIGTKTTVNKEESEFLSFIRTSEDLLRYSYRDGRVYKIPKNVNNSIKIDMSLIDTPFFWENGRVYCYMNRGGHICECAFYNMFEKEMLEDRNIFIKEFSNNLVTKNDNIKKDYEINILAHNEKSNINKPFHSEAVKRFLNISNDTSSNKINSFGDYFKNDTNSIELYKGIPLDKLDYLKFKTTYIKCPSCFVREENCDSWRLYNNECSNKVYWRKYHNSYCMVNDIFLDELFKNYKYKKRFSNKISVNIVLVGCGNFYELETLNKIAKTYDKKINVIVLDEGIWSLNSLKLIINDLSFNRLWFKRCDFNEELKNEIYDRADIIYYSRCLIHYKDDIRNSIFQKLNPIIRDNQLTVFSQVVNVQEPLPVEFENELRCNLLRNFKVISGYQTHRNTMIDVETGEEFESYSLQPELVMNRLNILPKYPLYYYMYVLDGRK